MSLIKEINSDNTEFNTTLIATCANELLVEVSTDTKEVGRAWVIYQPITEGDESKHIYDLSYTVTGFEDDEGDVITKIPNSIYEYLVTSKFKNQLIDIVENFDKDEH